MRIVATGDPPILAHPSMAWKSQNLDLLIDFGNRYLHHDHVPGQTIREVKCLAAEDPGGVKEILAVAVTRRKAELKGEVRKAEEDLHYYEQQLRSARAELNMLDAPPKEDGERDGRKKPQEKPEKSRYILQQSMLHSQANIRRLTGKILAKKQENETMLEDICESAGVLQ